MNSFSKSIYLAVVVFCFSCQVVIGKGFEVAPGYSDETQLENFIIQVIASKKKKCGRIEIGNMQTGNIIFTAGGMSPGFFSKLSLDKHHRVMISCEEGNVINLDFRFEVSPADGGTKN